jgi:hypothetical protein
MALCRATTNPDTYILLGGDASHHQDLYLPVEQTTSCSVGCLSSSAVILMHRNHDYNSRIASDTTYDYTGIRTLDNQLDIHKVRHTRRM